MTLLPPRLARLIKPRSSVMRTTLVISIVVVVSQVLSIAFFWQNLYLPEIRQHAHSAALRLDILRQSEAAGASALTVDQAMQSFGNLRVIREPAQFPKPVPKTFAEIFTRVFQDQLEEELQTPARVYFEFKPVPTLWIQAPTRQPMWVSEELRFIQQYSPAIIIGWVLGVPLLSVMAIVVLARQLNRPLKRLQLAAIRVGRGLHSTQLDEVGGSTEIRAVNRAFNLMTRQIREAERERAVMLAGISHDLRTPLTRMRLTAALLKDAEMAEGMALDIEDMDAILDQFIAFMRDGSEEHGEPTDLNHLVEEVAAQFHQQLAVHLDAGRLPLLRLRRLSFKRVLANLLQNILRYAAGPAEVRTWQDGGEVVLTCRDHGRGIDAARADDLMLPFRRGETARSTQGSGLGLAIVTRIVRQHHGTVSLRNHPDRGLVVEVRLPIDAA